MRAVHLLLTSFILSQVFCAGFPSNRNTSAKPRSLFGLLAFLTGYNLGHGVAPTSYNADIRDNAQLHLFAKLFNNALTVSYGKYVLPYTIVYPMQEAQLPLYPPLFASNTNIPVNQQQIVNIHEAPTQEADEKYDEIDMKNQQDIENHFNDKKIFKNFEETTKINEEEAESNEVTTQIEFIPIKQLPIPNLNSNTDSNSNSSSNSNLTSNLESNSTSINSNSSSNSTTETNSTSTEIPETNSMISTTESYNLTSNNSNLIIPSYGKYPYPVYHYYANKSSYENIAITTAPKLNTEIPESFENYLPRIDSPRVPFAPEKIVEKIDTGNSYLKYYYPSPYDTVKKQKFSNKLSDSEFKPIGNYFNEI